MKNKIIINIISISLIFLIDRFSKLLIIYLKEENNQASFTLTSFLNINLVWNEGIAFGLLSFENDLGYKPKISWETGVKKTIKWYKKYLSETTNLFESFYIKK